MNLLDHLSVNNEGRHGPARKYDIEACPNRELFSKPGATLLNQPLFSYLPPIRGGDMRTNWLGTLILILASQNAYPASNCQKLQIIPVEPLGTTEDNRLCRSGIDKLACAHHHTFKQFGRIKIQNTEALSVQDAQRDLDLVDTAMRRFHSSPAIQEILNLTITAREISQHPWTCEPILVRIAQKSLSGAGPAFFNGQHFLYRQRIYRNFLDIGSSVMGSSLLESLEPEKVLQSGYFEIVIAHELAHALMQDLYGVSELESMLSKSVSRDGHDVSTVTDPQLAWVEGFAEGFEAYLGEKTLKPKDLAPITLDFLFKNLISNIQTRQSDNGDSFWGIIKTIFQSRNEITWVKDNLSNIITDFLKSGRQQELRRNYFVRYGEHIHFIKRYPDFPMSYDDIDGIVSNEVETDNAIQSKEGAIGFIIYTFLREGLVNELFRTIAVTKPHDISQFLAGFRKLYPNLMNPKLEFAIKSTLSQVGRELLVKWLPPQAGSAFELDFVIQKLNDLPPVTSMKPPVALWVEFETTKRLQKLLMGSLDRINLLTARRGRLGHYINEIFKKDKIELDDVTRDWLIESLIEARTAVSPDSVLKTYAVGLSRIIKSTAKENTQLAQTLRKVQQSIFKDSTCFTTRCLSNEERLFYTQSLETRNIGGP